ncbi:uncharacterized protein EV422DRAFT_523003 [Fimicolochytrium jonesii]|uniref:uncharacterized protein n=1 Tax=Fimicolochytrium jonesii TaxID=1396493 RepID=UPI0022FDD822|nr:uncharacterized protein EV422DRAFT_523003 [Fimicolochytrium jonesii]KAI8823007.1 hypothetical protein EV422DRAFT_523003 [Fimicolochytrium jonesii]
MIQSRGQLATCLQSLLAPRFTRILVSNQPRRGRLVIRQYSATTKLSTPASPFVCDVCVVGGGIVGTALASAIARPGRTSSALKVALIEAGDLYRKPATEPGVYSNRVSSITNTTFQFLEDLGVWDTISSDRRRPYYTMKVWDAIGSGQITFDASEGLPAGIPVDPIAQIVENTHLQAALVNGLKEKTQVHVYNNAKVERISVEAQAGGGGESKASKAIQWPIVQLADGRTIQTRLLVGADGANSSVRSYAGIDSIGWDYGQMGIVATLAVDSHASGNPSAWQRFLPTGPVALLPLSDTHSSLVWTVSAKLAPLLCSLPSKDFTALLNAALTLPWKDVEFLCSQISKEGVPLVDFDAEVSWSHERLATNQAARVRRKATFKPPGVLSVVEKTRAAFPLRLRNSENYIGDRVALIGDAAHTVHPLAGQGLNLGLADAELLADVLADALDVGSDIGHPHVLQNYSRGRYLPNLVMMKSIDSIGKLFKTENALIAKVRSAGFNVVDALGPLKRGIVGFAS